MKYPLRLIAAITAALALTATAAQADVPQSMNVQGRLTDTAGVPLPAGPKDFTFKIFDTQVAGVEVWPAGPGELQSIATDADGLWTARVGALLGLTEAVFQDTSRWLEVTVDDGVNPVETLPRIKLNTNPFTYRSASSQNSDALGGLGSDDFVHVAGDAMEGVLTFGQPFLDGYWQLYGYASSSPLITANALAPAGASLDFYNSSGWNQMGFEPDFNGQGGYFYVTGDSNFSSACIIENPGDGNIALQMFGDSSSTNIYTGFSGDASVQLPADAISSGEILDEPGIVRNSNIGSVGLTGTAETMVDLVTVTITIPAAGYIDLHGQVGEMDLGGTTGFNWTWIQIDETAGGFIQSNVASVEGAYAFATTGSYIFSPSVSRVYYKAAPGVYTFRLEATQTSISTGTADAFYSSLTATYIPTAYGTVIAPVASNDLSDFESVNTVSVSSPATGGTPVEVHQVDLRQLELKAVRAEAAAQKAKADWLEAAKAVNQPALQGKAHGGLRGDQ